MQDLSGILQGSGISAIIVYLGAKELMSRMNGKRNGNDRTKWKTMFESHEARLDSIENTQKSMDRKLDMILSSLIKH